jgi:LPS export ABC transporter protein LptC
MNRTTGIALLLLLGMVAVAVWQGGGTPGLAPEPTGGNVPRYRIEGLQALRTDAKGLPLVRLTADEAEYFDGGAARMVNLEAAGLTGEAAPWMLKAPAGSVAAGEKRLRLHAPVTGTGRWNDGEPFTFQGNNVWLDDSTRQFSSTEPLVLDSATRKARAKGFVAGFDGQSLQLTQPELRYDLGE